MRSLSRQPAEPDDGKRILGLPQPAGEPPQPVGQIGRNRSMGRRSGRTDRRPPTVRIRKSIRSKGDGQTNGNVPTIAPVRRTSKCPTLKVAGDGRGKTQAEPRHANSRLETRKRRRQQNPEKATERGVRSVDNEASGSCYEPIRDESKIKTSSGGGKTIQGVRLFGRVVDGCGIRIHPRLASSS